MIIGDLWAEMRRAASVSANFRSFIRLTLDLVLCRRPFLSMIPRRYRNSERSVVLRAGIRLTYRLNKGDIWSLREVWLFDSYKFPGQIQPKLVLDLGANIGLTSVWLATRYQTHKVIAVEAVSANADLARRNLAQNNVNAVVIPAAVGSRDGSVRFVERSESNFGRADYGESGSTPMVSVKTVLETHCPGEQIDLLKLDIEGGEQELLSSNLEWLRSVHAIIAELHPGLIDHPALIETLRECGFRYLPANSVFPDNMDSFVREPSPA